MKIGILSGVLAGVCWGTVFLAPAILSGSSSISISIARYMFYGIISAAFIAPFARRIFARLSRKSFMILVKLVITGNIIYFILVGQAIQMIGVAPSSLIVGLVPVTAVLFGRSSGSLSLKTLAGPLVMIAVGLVCINIDVFNYLDGVSTLNKILGIVCAFGALASWSWYAIDNAKYLQLNRNFTPHEWSLLFGVVTGLVALSLGAVMLLTPLSILPQGSQAGDVQLFILICMGLAFIPSFLGNIFWNTAAQRLPITLSGQMIVFETVFALLYGFIYYHRLPRILEIFAIICLVGGVVWSVRKHR